MLSYLVVRHEECAYGTMGFQPGHSCIVLFFSSEIWGSLLPKVHKRLGPRLCFLYFLFDWESLRQLLKENNTWENCSANDGKTMTWWVAVKSNGCQCYPWGNRSRTDEVRLNCTVELQSRKRFFPSQLSYVLMLGLKNNNTNQHACQQDIKLYTRWGLSRKEFITTKHILKKWVAHKSLL